MPPEALSFVSEHSHAWKELYEVPGGDEVDGSPPAPVRPPGRGGQSDDFSSVLLQFERYVIIYIQKVNFCAKHWHINSSLKGAELTR
eukprot:5773084-Pyramimonas_sp.AAC.1